MHWILDYKRIKLNFNQFHSSCTDITVVTERNLHTSLMMLAVKHRASVLKAVIEAMEDRVRLVSHTEYTHRIHTQNTRTEYTHRIHTQNTRTEYDAEINVVIYFPII